MYYDIEVKSYPKARCWIHALFDQLEAECRSLLRLTPNWCPKSWYCKKKYTCCQASIGLCKVDTISKKKLPVLLPYTEAVWISCTARVSKVGLPYLNSWPYSKPYEIQCNSTHAQKFTEQISLQPLRDTFYSAYVSLNCRGGSCRGFSCWNMVLRNASGLYQLLMSSWLIKSIWFHIFHGNISNL